MASRRRPPEKRAVVRKRAAAPSEPVPVRAPSVELGEPPHAHIVCQSCGRISPMELLPGEGQQLIALADRRPDGWDVRRIAFSLTGTCAACREGRRP